MQKSEVQIIYQYYIIGFCRNITLRKKIIENYS